MVDTQAFTQQRMNDLLATWNATTPDSKVFVDIMIHSKFNFPENHKAVLTFITNTLHTSAGQDMLWRMNRVVPDVATMNEIVAFIKTQYITN